MMKKKSTFQLFVKIVVLFVLFAHTIQAKDDTLGVKLEKIISSTEGSLEKIYQLRNFATSNISTHDSLAKIAVYKSFKLAQKIDSSITLGHSYIFLSWYEEQKGSIQKAYHYAQEAMALLKGTQPDYNMVWLYGHASWISRRLEKNGEAMEYAIQSLEMAQAIKDTVLIASGYTKIAALYMGLEDYQKARQYHFKTLQLYEIIDDEMGMATTYGNLGIVNKRLRLYDSALIWHRKGLEIVKKEKHLSQIAFFYNDIGATLLKNNNFDSAIYYLNQSIQLRESMNEQNEIAYTYNYMGEAYEKKGKLEEAEGWIKKSLSRAKATGNVKQQQEALESLSVFFAKSAKFDSAYYYLHEFKLLADTINESKRADLIDQLAVKYETEQKEQAIELLNKTTALQKMQLRQRGALLIAALTAFITTVLFFVYKNRQKRLEAQNKLQAVLAEQQATKVKAILEAEEKERKRIAGELHDGVGQILTAALLNFKQINSELKKGKTPNNDELDNALQLIDEGYKEIRNISHQMMPNALLKNSLADAVRDFLNKINQQQLSVHLHVEGLDERLDADMESVLYRVVQECVNNVIKHANADRLDISLIHDKEGISLTIEDNGKGFDFNHIRKKEGIGLKNISSRVEYLKGTVEFDSSYDAGTLVAIFIPIDSIAL